MDRINIVSLVMIVGGFTLLYGAVKGKNPLSIVQNAVQGKPPSEAAGLK